MAANQPLKKSGSVWTPEPELQCYNSDLIAFFNGIATRILNGAPVQFKPIPMNVAATGTLLPNSSFPNDTRA